MELGSMRAAPRSGISYRLVKRPGATRKSTTRALALNEGRELLRKQAWSAAFSRLSEADREQPLEPDDLQGLASAAHLIGMEAESADFLARAHRGFLARGE